MLNDTITLQRTEGQHVKMKRFILLIICLLIFNQKMLHTLRQCCRIFTICLMNMVQLYFL